MACTRVADRRAEPVGAVARLGPERDARAVAGEPEQRRVDVVDRPHHRRLVRVRRRHVRARTGWMRRVLAEVQEVRRIGLVPGLHGPVSMPGPRPCRPSGRRTARPMIRRRPAPYGDSMQTVTLDDPLALDVTAVSGSTTACGRPHRRRLTLGLVLHHHAGGVRGPGHLDGDARRLRRPRRASASTAGCSAGSSSGNLLGIVVAGQAADQRGTALPFLAGLVRVHGRV